MAEIAGLQGLRAAKDKAEALATPPYDVIKEGSLLETLLSSNPESFFHVTLGPNPAQALQDLKDGGVLIEDAEPAFYVYEQKWPGGERLGFFAAVAVSAYAEGHIVRHEKTFDEKVKGRLKVTNETGYTLEPIFLLTKSPIQPILEKVRDEQAPEYDIKSDFKGWNDLHGIASRFFRVPEAFPAGQALKRAVAENPLYIADGHHRYHAALLNGQTHAMAYIVEKARILAYNRVINGTRKFKEIMGKLDLRPADAFTTPDKHSFRIYTKDGTFTLKARNVPGDVVGRLDCSILEKELYPHLGVEHSMILQKKHFDYYPESDLATMKSLVDQGEYDLAVALAPVSIDELMAVADAGMKDSEVVMPEKSTFFAPKILSGVVLYRHSKR
ncbi:MAG TPA: DUF1015 family protein [Fibrobacteria bacterium]|nr:DUF1015 family protein [Fibrobacteria bacterium]